MKVRSTVEPQEVTFTANSVFIASNITPYSEEVDGRLMEGYEYDWTEYTKDAYLQAQLAQVEELKQELAATKILLGVD